MHPNPDIRRPGGSSGKTSGRTARNGPPSCASEYLRAFASWGRSLRSWSVCGVLLPIVAPAFRGEFPGLILAQQPVPEVTTPSYVLDAIVVVVLCGAALYAICRAGRRN